MRLILLMICAVSLGACGPAQPAAHTAHCSALEARPVPSALPKPAFRVGVAVHVDEQQLLHTLSKVTPRTVASGRGQDIGAAGRVDYDVVRSALRLETSSTSLRVSTRLEGDIRVCKPLGPFCARYGTCRPSWQVAFEVPTRFESGIELQARTQIQLDKGCVLQPVGYDASGELEKITRGQAANVRRRVARELEATERQLARAWQRLTEPTALPTAGCLRVSDPTLSYSPPMVTDGTLAFAAELRATATLTRPSTSAAQTGCEADSEESREPRAPVDLATLPVQVAPDLEPEVDVTLVEPWPTNELQLALQQALGKAAVVSIVGGERAGTANELFVALQKANDAQGPAQSCATWVKVEPELDAGKLRLVPSNEDRENPSAAEKDLVSSLSAVRLPLPLGSTFAAPSSAPGSSPNTEAELALERLAPKLAELLPLAREHAEQYGLHLEHDLRVRQEVLIDAQGLQLVQRLQGRVRLVTARFPVAADARPALSSKQ